MSIWAHVIGCIRIDGILAIGDDKKDIEKIIGPMSLWDSWNDDSTLPVGSEGSLQYKIIEYADGLPWLVIPIWGDLRDYENISEIKKWWEELLIKLGIIRDAVLLIQIEGNEQIILT